MTQRGATPRSDQRQLGPQLIGRIEVQEILGVSRATLWRLVRSGSLPVVRIDGRVRFLLEDVSTFIHSRRSRRAS
jgi:excisionase family DNA binding protein